MAAEVEITYHCLRHGFTYSRPSTCAKKNLAFEYVAFEDITWWWGDYEFAHGFNLVVVHSAV